VKNIDAFIEAWVGKNAMSPQSADDITQLESQMGCILPNAYKYLLSTYGLVRSPNVMSKTIDLDTKLGQVHDFLSLDDVASLSSLYEMSGMEKGHILFASDASGNMFCFKLTDCLVEQEDVAVWFFDRSNFSIEKVSDSFMQWLQAFNKS
jgi:hypothetical protein